MTTATPTARGAAAREPIVRAAVAALGAVSLALGIFMAVAPSAFFDAIGPFGARNGHYIRDMATWQIAVGGALLVAAGRPAWRRPLIAVGAAQALLHAVNHVVDVGDADPTWVGVFDLVTIAATLGLFAWLWSATAEVNR